MNSLVIALGAIVLFWLGYQFYSRAFEKIWDIDVLRETPAVKHHGIVNDLIGLLCDSEGKVIILRTFILFSDSSNICKDAFSVYFKMADIIKRKKVLG